MVKYSKKTDQYNVFVVWLIETLEDSERTGITNPLEIRAKSYQIGRENTRSRYRFEAKFTGSFLRKNRDARIPRTGRNETVENIWEYYFCHDYEDGMFEEDQYVSGQLGTIQKDVESRNYKGLTSQLNNNGLSIVYDTNK